MRRLVAEQRGFRDRFHSALHGTSKLIVQTVAGFTGAKFSATALHEHRFGRLRHSLVGLVAGAPNGYFLQTVVLMVVTGSGSRSELRTVEAAVIETFSGAVVGAIAMAVIGFAIHASSQRA